MPEDFSKPIRKTDEESKKLIIEALDGEVTGGFDIESIYNIPGEGWIVLEFLKCDTVRPFESHPNRYWHLNARKFISLWNLTKKLEGKLILINYEKSREQFLIIEVCDMDEKGIRDETKTKMNMQEFSTYFKGFNRRARQVT
jgi:hypothetical protein